MGEARRIGSFEERKEKAIQEGRIKRKTYSTNKILESMNPLMAFMALLMSGTHRKKKGRKVLVNL